MPHHKGYSKNLITGENLRKQIWSLTLSKTQKLRVGETCEWPKVTHSDLVSLKPKGLLMVPLFDHAGYSLQRLTPGHGDSRCHQTADV